MINYSSFFSSSVGVNRTVVRTVSSNTSITINDGSVYVDASLGDVTVTLPLASDAFDSVRGGLVFTIKKIDSTPNKVIITAVDNIDDLSQLEIDIYNISVSLQSNGTTYKAI